MARNKAKLQADFLAASDAVFRRAGNKPSKATGPWYIRILDEEVLAIAAYAAEVRKLSQILSEEKKSRPVHAGPERKPVAEIKPASLKRRLARDAAKLNQAKPSKTK